MESGSGIKKHSGPENLLKLSGKMEKQTFQDKDKKPLSFIAGFFKI
jgi:hypothetical protein